MTASTGTPVSGGTAYWAEQPLSPPNYIFPLVSGAYYSNENVNQFQTLMYRPLYWYGDKGKPGADYALSLGNAPVYSDHDRVGHDHAEARDGGPTARPVSRRDVGLLDQPAEGQQGRLGLIRAGRVPGQRDLLEAASGPRTIRLQLNRSYNPIWFTNNELSQITPLPLAWDRTVTRGGTPMAARRPGHATRHHDRRGQGRLQVPQHQAKNLSGYATQPDLVGRRRPLEAQPAEPERPGDVRPERQIRRPQQAAPGEVRRAAVHQ